MNDTLVKQAVAGLGLIVLVALGGIIYLSANDRTPPDVLEQAVTAGIVAIAGLLPGALNRRVEIDQPRHDPIPVADVGERGQAELLTVLVVVLVVLIFLKVFGVI